MVSQIHSLSNNTEMGITNVQIQSSRALKKTNLAENFSALGHNNKIMSLRGRAETGEQTILQV